MTAVAGGLDQALEAFARGSITVTELIDDVADLSRRLQAEARAAGIGPLTEGVCVRCGTTVPMQRRRSDEWRASHHCIACLNGPAPSA